MLTQIAIALGLAADCFAASVCLGLSKSQVTGLKNKSAATGMPKSGKANHGKANYAVAGKSNNFNILFSRYLPAISFGFFQGAMAALGYFLGTNLSATVSFFDHWIAFILLAYVGGRMLYSSIKDGSCADLLGDGIRPLIMVSIATSIDAFAVGLSLAFLKEDIMSYSIIIGLVSFAVSVIGIRFGRAFGTHAGKWAGIAGGVVLVGIGTRILLSHLGIMA